MQHHLGRGKNIEGKKKQDSSSAKKLPWALQSVTLGRDEQSAACVLLSWGRAAAWLWSARPGRAGGSRGKPAAVTAWRARDRLLLQVENAGHSFPQARSTSANTLTMLFGLGFFCTAFFFFLFFLLVFFFFPPEVLRPQHTDILSKQSLQHRQEKILFPFFSGGRIEAVGWQDLPNTMVRVGRQGCFRGCTSFTPAPLQRGERLRRSTKMHELVFIEPAGICRRWLWQLGACCVNLPTEQRTGEMQGEERVGRGVRCWRWRGGNERAPAWTAGCREQPRDHPWLRSPAHLLAPLSAPPSFF